MVSKLDHDVEIEGALKRCPMKSYMWQSQVENEHYFILSGLNSIGYILIEITPDFLCPFMND